MFMGATSDHGNAIKFKHFPVRLKNGYGTGDNGCYHQIVA